MHCAASSCKDSNKSAKAQVLRPESSSKQHKNDIKNNCDTFYRIPQSPITICPMKNSCINLGLSPQFSCHLFHFCHYTKEANSHQKNIHNLLFLKPALLNAMQM